MLVALGVGVRVRIDTDLHSTAAVIPVVHLRVTVIEAAATVVMSPTHDRVDRLWVVAGRNTSRFIHMVAEPGVEPESKHYSEEVEPISI